MGDFRILVVDDEPIIRKMLEIALKSAGYQVILAADGSEAIELLHDETFDLVITDLQMGDLDGFAVIKKAKDLNPLSKSIVVTGNQDVSSAIKAIRLGVEDYFLKPFSPSELLACVKKSVDKLVLAPKTEVKYAKKSSAEEQMYSLMLLMSHDIRSALVSMSASLKLLKKRDDGKIAEGMADELNMLSSRCAKLTTIAEEYLGKIFLIKNNTDQLEGKQINLVDDVVTPVLNELSVDLEENGIGVDNYIESSITKAMITGDLVQLKAVFRNLFKNGIKYGGKGCTIGFDVEKKSNHYKLAVFNTGDAIPEHLQNKLFMRKGRWRKNNNNKQGAGIGLYLTKNIIQKHGGDMWYEKIDAAPHFVFTLPMNKTMRLLETGVRAP